VTGVDENLPYICENPKPQLIGGLGACYMGDDALNLDIRRIVTDSDLDGVVTAAILKRHWTDAEVFFGHPGELRAGRLDHLMDDWTAVCDLPLHPNCGLSIDHHQSNRPTELTKDGPCIIWEDEPSAARIAYKLVGSAVDLSDLEELLVWVDKLDGGGITRDEFLSEHPVVWLGRIVDEKGGIAMCILESLADGLHVDEILTIPEISDRVEQEKKRRGEVSDIISERVTIKDRMAIARLEGLGIRSNGYLVTALVDDSCDACMVIHGDIGADFGEEGRYPVSASFYTNSFLHENGGIFDLTKLATRFDSDGGGHANACGCRIQPLFSGERDDRTVEYSDIEENIAKWLEIWSERD